MDKNSNGEAQHLTAVLLEANSKALLTDEDIADDDVGAADDGDDRDGDDGADTNADTNLRCWYMKLMLFAADDGDLMLMIMMMMLLIS